MIKVIVRNPWTGLGAGASCDDWPYGNHSSRFSWVGSKRSPRCGISSRSSSCRPRSTTNNWGGAEAWATTTVVTWCNLVCSYSTKLLQTWIWIPLRRYTAVQYSDHRVIEFNSIIHYTDSVTPELEEILHPPWFGSPRKEGKNCSIQWGKPLGRRTYSRRPVGIYVFLPFSLKWRGANA